MYRLLVTASIVMLSAAVFAESDAAMDEAFENLADEYVSDLTNFSPTAATLIGDHSADHKLDRVDGKARAETRELLLEYIDALEGIDVDGLSRANQIDAQILANQLRSDLFALDDLQEWAWNPLYYTGIAGTAIYGLVARDFAPVTERLGQCNGPPRTTTTLLCRSTCLTKARARAENPCRDCNFSDSRAELDH